MTRELSKEQQAQAADYDFPYHHLLDADLSAGQFKSYKNLSFALPYAVTAKLILDVLQQNAVAHWCDIGCGDGGLFATLESETSQVKKNGIDYDQRSIKLAKLLNTTDCCFRQQDILEEAYVPSEFQLVTLIEVFEHVPPDIASSFLAKVGEHVAIGGTLIITVPHKNQRMPAKHFRHFDLAEMENYCAEILSGFEIQKVCGFNVKNAIERFVKGVLRTKHIFLEMPWLNRKRLKAQLDAIPVSERHCQQIFLILKRVI